MTASQQTKEWGGDLMAAQSGRRRIARIFLSHAAADAEIGLELKKELEKRIPRARVFLSSDPTDLPPGVIWSKAIQRALFSSDVLLLVVTSRSLGRPWVWFEVGTAWQRVPVVPMCLGEPRKNTLVAPLSELQGVNADFPEDLRILLDRLARLFKRPASAVGVDVLASRLQELDERGGRRISPHGWAGVEWNGRFLAYSGPLEPLKLIEDEILHPAMLNALVAGRYRPYKARADKLSHHAEKGYRVVYLTDRESWRRRVVDGDLLLVARPLKPGEAPP